jgi:hypothetical protein
LLSSVSSPAAVSTLSAIRSLSFVRSGVSPLVAQAPVCGARAKSQLCGDLLI